MKEIKINLLDFVIRTLNEIDGSSSYKHSWHIELMCSYLLKLYSGEFNRLIINVPPRSLKSICISVAFPAWILAQNPKQKIISVSYSQALSNKHSTDCRKVMNSKWYKKLTETRITKGESEKKKFVTQKNGYRFATSTGGTLTGEGGNLIIVDDPQNPTKIHKKSERKKTKEWFESTLISRLNNKKTGKMIVVMQRLHEQDLSGELLAKKKSSWKLLSLPLIEGEEMAYLFDNQKYFFRSKGNILHEYINTGYFIEEMKNDMGHYNFFAQYQQQPQNSKGLIDISKIKKYILNYPQDGIYLSIDTALGYENSDYTIIMEIVISNDICYIFNIHKNKINYQNLKLKIIELTNSKKILGILIEDRNFGSSLISELKILSIPIIKINPLKNKVDRMLKSISFIENEKLYINESVTWNDSFLDELRSFPNGKNDDQVDSLSQFLNWYIDITNKIIPKNRKFKYRTIKLD